MTLNLDELEAELKPCPFCGTPASREPYRDEYGQEWDQIICPKCHAHVMRALAKDGSGSDVVERWNARTPAPELIAAAREREELKAKLAEEVRRTQYWMHEALGRDSDGDERDAAVRGVVAQRDELAGLLRHARSVVDTWQAIALAGGLGTRSLDLLADRIDAALAKVHP